ncbi:MAG: NAD-dependent epimerase/dehydratase family protein [Victivallales bacterium]|nr:NAD-dependent epimerase/dehydratase family protein [Victivallales bacterium]
MSSSPVVHPWSHGLVQSTSVLSTEPKPQLFSAGKPARLRILILGGSGFISGNLARRAIQAGHQVTIVTRGRRPIPDGVEALKADRKQPGELSNTLLEWSLKQPKPLQPFDLVVDCLAWAPEHIRQDLALFCGTGQTHLVVLSTDQVYAPKHRTFPQTDEGAVYLEDQSDFAERRRCEQMLLCQDKTRRWTVLRPTIVLGAGGRLDFFPEHLHDDDVAARLRRGEALRLAGGGHFLCQPIYVGDLVELILACPSSSGTTGRILDCPGPETLEIRQVYEAAAKTLGTSLSITEIPAAQRLETHPEELPWLCHRFYPHGPLRLSGLPVPHVSPGCALREQLA